jgi:hypothetical protein
VAFSSPSPDDAAFGNCAPAGRYAQAFEVVIYYRNGNGGATEYRNAGVRDIRFTHPNLKLVRARRHVGNLRVAVGIDIV